MGTCEGFFLCAKRESNSQPGGFHLGHLPAGLKPLCTQAYHNDSSFCRWGCFATENLWEITSRVISSPHWNRMYHHSIWWVHMQLSMAPVTTLYLRQWLQASKCWNNMWIWKCHHEGFSECGNITYFFVQINTEFCPSKGTYQELLSTGRLIRR